MLFLMLPAGIAVMCQLIMDHNPVNNRRLGIVSAELDNGLETCTSVPHIGCGDLQRPLTCRLMDYLHNNTIRTVSSMYQYVRQKAEESRRER